MRLAPPRLALAALLLVPFLGACGGGGDSGTTSDAVAGHVNVIDNKFAPKTIEVAPGDTVTWDFKGSAQHNVTGAAGLKSGNMKSGTYEHKFNSAGTYNYVCTIHPGMSGKVKVS
jgi:plastocyanin